MVAANGLIDAAEASGNPWVLAYTLSVCGVAFRDTDSGRALEALRRGVLISQDSGNRFFETKFSYWLCGLEAEQGDQAAALEYLAVAIRNNHESGNVRHVAQPPGHAAHPLSTGSDVTNQRPPSPVSQPQSHGRVTLPNSEH